MSIKPSDYNVTAEMLIQRMNLYEEDIQIFPTGIEYMFDDKTNEEEIDREIHKLIMRIQNYVFSNYS